MSLDLNSSLRKNSKKSENHFLKMKKKENFKKDSNTSGMLIADACVNDNDYDEQICLAIQDSLMEYENQKNGSKRAKHSHRGKEKGVVDTLDDFIVPDGFIEYNDNRFQIPDEKKSRRKKADWMKSLISYGVECVNNGIDCLKKHLPFYSEPPPPPPPPPPAPPKRLSSQELQAQQDRIAQNVEYETAIQEELEKKERIEREEFLKKQLDEAETIRIKKEKEMSLKKLSDLKNAFKNLMPEPEVGVTIAVVLPNQKRIVRKFDPNELGKDVFLWVSVDDSMIKDDTYINEFELTRVMAPSLEKDKTLGEQGIKGRIIFQVLLKE